MGNFAPVFLAFILNCYGVHIFREPQKNCLGPLLSYLIFLISLFLLLWDMRLYPKSLRKLWRCGNCFLQLLVAGFIMEHLLMDFWFPLETAVITATPALAEYLEELIGSQGGESFFEMLKCETAGMVSSYFLSIFFFLAVLHATRAIDFGIISECGIRFFFKDIFCRLNSAVRCISKWFYRAKPKKVDVCDLSDPSPPDDDNYCSEFQCNRCNYYLDHDGECDCDCQKNDDSDSYSDYECEPPLPSRRRR